MKLSKHLKQSEKKVETKLEAFKTDIDKKIDKVEKQF